MPPETHGFSDCLTLSGSFDASSVVSMGQMHSVTVGNDVNHAGWHVMFSRSKTWLYQDEVVSKALAHVLIGELTTTNLTI